MLALKKIFSSPMKPRARPLFSSIREDLLVLVKICSTNRFEMVLFFMFFSKFSWGGEGCRGGCNSVPAFKHDCFLDLSNFRKNYVLTKTGYITCAFLRVEVERGDLKHNCVLGTY